MNNLFIEPNNRITRNSLNEPALLGYYENAGSGNGKLTGLKALVTHACSGIGRDVAIAFARAGADVIISYQHEEEAKETAKQITEAGRQAVLLPGDISQEEQCKELVRRAVKVFGRLNILVNNAALSAVPAMVGENTEEALDRTFRTNLYTMYNLCHTALPYLKPGSTIVNTTLATVPSSTPTLLSYSTERKTIQNFTTSLALLVEDKDIRVNCVALDADWSTNVSLGFFSEISNLVEYQPTPVNQVERTLDPALIYVSLATQNSDYKSGDTVQVAAN